jgi:uncharacterized protein (UPF0305 family)
LSSKSFVREKIKRLGNEILKIAPNLIIALVVEKDGLRKIADIESIVKFTKFVLFVSDKYDEKTLESFILNLTERLERLKQYQKGINYS